MGVFKRAHSCVLCLHVRVSAVCCGWAWSVSSHFFHSQGLQSASREGRAELGARCSPECSHPDLVGAPPHPWLAPHLTVCPDPGVASSPAVCGALPAGVAPLP